MTVYTDDGEAVDSINIPAHPTAQVTSTAWHPTKKMLAVGWETGELFLYSDHNNSCVELQTIHTSSILILEWSGGGSRLVSGDGSGSVVGWALDRQHQLNTVFHHELKDPLSQMIFRNVSSPHHQSGLDMSSLARAGKYSILIGQYL